MIRAALLATLATAAPAWAEPWPQEPPRNPDAVPAFPEQTRAPALPATAVTAVEFAGPLENPWGMAPLPDGSLLVTERPGRLRLVGPDGTLSDPIAGVPEVDARSQGGLLDVAVSPTFAEDRMIYITYAETRRFGRRTVTAVASARLSDDATRLEDVTEIFSQEPVSHVPMHFGSRVVPLPDGNLAISLGEHSDEEHRDRARMPDSAFGKVVRIGTDGTPMGDPTLDEGGIGVWTMGHRNPQGLALDPSGQLWATEHGPEGGDELNRIVAGADYGWPMVSYGIDYDGTPVGEGSSAPGVTEPVYYWDPVIAVSGIAFYQGDVFPDWTGSLLLASLNPGGLVRLTFAGEGEAQRVAGEERMLTDLGRIRDVEVLPDGQVLILTDDPAGAIWRVDPA